MALQHHSNHLTAAVSDARTARILSPDPAHQTSSATRLLTYTPHPSCLPPLALSPVQRQPCGRMLPLGCKRCSLPRSLRFLSRPTAARGVRHSPTRTRPSLSPLSHIGRSCLALRWVRSPIARLLYCSCTERESREAVCTAHSIRFRVYNHGVPCALQAEDVNAANAAPASVLKIARYFARMSTNPKKVRHDMPLRNANAVSCQWPVSCCPTKTMHVSCSI